MNLGGNRAAPSGMRSPLTFKSTFLESGTTLSLKFRLSNANPSPTPRDNVNSVGLVPHRLPFTMENSGIRVYRHAVSLDERRAEFAASLAPQSGGAEEGHNHSEERRRGDPQKKPTLRELEKRWSDPQASTDVLEVWFAGKWFTRRMTWHANQQLALGCHMGK